jgi:plasmid stabilization system protein ParE
VKRFHFSRRAAEELTSAAQYYARIDPELAGRFYDEIDGLIQAIRRNPDRYRKFDGDIRRRFSRVFPYAVLNVEQSDRILIIAVTDMRRRPGYWKF